MATRRRRKKSFFSVETTLVDVLKLLVWYELIAYGWNYFGTASGADLPFALPADGIGTLIGYPGTGDTGLLTTD